MASNQEPHIVYPQPYPTYQSAAPLGVWNQPPSQTVTYIPIHQGEMTTYADKASYGGYPPLAYVPDNGQQQYATPQYAQSAQWHYQQPGQSHFIPTYATTFNAVNDPNYQGGPPPMNRPPPNMKRDDFHGAIGMMENPAQSAAAYTASWVSSTSSIPPEMRDEPECDVPQNWEGGQDQNNASGGQWPGLNDENRSKNEKGGKKYDRREGQPARELTFDERLQKARMQKSRVENEGLENTNGGSTPPAAQGGSTSRGGRPERGGGRGRGGQHNGGDRRPREYYKQDGQRDGEARGGYNGGRGGGGRRGGNNGGNNGGGNNGGNGGHSGHSGNAGMSNVGGVSYVPQMGGMMSAQMAPMQYQPQQTMYAPQQYVMQAPMPQGYVDPQMFATINAFQNAQISYAPVRRMPLLPGPFGMIPHQTAIQQDVKFRNTWLDAQNFLPYAPVMSNDSRGRGGYRGRGRGNSSRGNGRGGRYEKRDEKREGGGEKSPEEVESTESETAKDGEKPSSSAAPAVVEKEKKDVENNTVEDKKVKEKEKKKENNQKTEGAVQKTETEKEQPTKEENDDDTSGSASDEQSSSQEEEEPTPPKTKK